MEAKQPVIGQRYRNTHVTSWKDEWVIDAIFTGTDGLQYADLRSVSDRTAHKTLALSVVTDPRRFVPVEAAAAEAGG